MEVPRVTLLKSEEVLKLSLSLSLSSSSWTSTSSSTASGGDQNCLKKKLLRFCAEITERRGAREEAEPGGEDRHEEPDAGEHLHLHDGDGLQDLCGQCIDDYGDIRDDTDDDDNDDDKDEADKDDDVDV